MSVSPDGSFRRRVVSRVNPSAHPIASNLAVFPFPIPSVIIPRSRLIFRGVVTPADVAFRSIMLLMHFLRVSYVPCVIVRAGIVNVRASVCDRRSLSRWIIFFRVAVHGCRRRGNVAVVPGRRDSVGAGVVPAVKRKKINFFQKL